MFCSIRGLSPLLLCRCWAWQLADSELSSVARPVHVPSTPQAAPAAPGPQCCWQGLDGSLGTPWENAFGEGAEEEEDTWKVEGSVSLFSSHRINAQLLFVLHEIPKRWELKELDGD